MFKLDKPIKLTQSWQGVYLKDLLLEQRKYVHKNI